MMMVGRRVLKKILPSLNLKHFSTSLFKSSVVIIIPSKLYQKSQQLTGQLPLRQYHPPRSLMMRNQKNGLMADPEKVSARLIKIVSLHDNVKDPSSVTLRKTFKQLGLNQLDVVQIMLMCEEEFFIEFTQTEGQSAHTVEDLARMIATNFYTQ